MTSHHIVITSLAVIAIAGCATSHESPMPTVPHVELTRFMGPWYVIASIPTFLEKGAYNAIESYALNADGTIAVTFTFRKGAFDGPLKTMTPHGFVLDSSNALWGMQFVWPIKADYRIAYLDDSYSEVIIARKQRDYVWIMARSPQVSAADYQRLVSKVGELGYNIDKLIRVPQQWP